MSPQRVADAANIAPFLTHAVNHHGQQTLIPPDSEGRVRRVKHKKNRSRTRHERNVRPEEEIRFNTGSPRSARSPVVPPSRARRPARTARQERARDDEYDEFTIPDYPPPSFLEAISSPPPSVCASIRTPANVSQPPPSSIAGSSTGPSQNPQPSTQPPSLTDSSQPLTSSNNFDVHSDSESDSSSLEIIDLEHLQDRPSASPENVPTKELMRRRGIEFPTPSQSVCSQSRDEGVSEASTSRGRLTKTRSRGILESDPEDVVAEVETPTPKLTKRRHLSLSPLRTLFPYRPSGIPEQTASAHPSPTSPYSFSRSSPSFFRSTTSLRMPLSTPSLLKLPLSSSTTSSSKSENLRKLFPSKGKERAKSLHENEAWDSWEIVDSNPQLSLMSAVETVANPPPPPSLEVFPPTQSQNSLPSQLPDRQEHPPASVPSQEARSSEDRNINSIPSSSRDRMPPLSSSANRQVRRPPPPPPPVRTKPVPIPASPNADSSRSVQSIGTGPPLTSVQTKKVPIPPPKKKPQVITSSPLGADPWGANEAEDSRSFVTFRRALETPLPASPVDAGHLEHDPRTPVTPILANTHRDAKHSPIWPAFAGSKTSMKEDDAIPSPYAQSPFANPHDNRMLYAPWASSSQCFPESSSLSRPSPSRASAPPSDEVHTRPFHHYHGRPLPRPPISIRTMVDSTYGARDSIETETTSQIGERCPGGLLIDFDETPSTSHTRGDSSIHHGPDGSHSRSQTEYSSGIADVPTLNSCTPTSSRTILPSSNTTLSPSIGSEITDLDVLVTRLDEEEWDGTGYDARLLVSEFMGPASPSRRDGDTPSLADNTSPTPNPSLPGIVQSDRRRVMADGRVKLKLSLFGTGVDRCGICQSQFKDGQLAEMSASCRHVFHGRCLGPWLARSRTCPLCRVPLEPGG